MRPRAELPNGDEVTRGVSRRRNNLTVVFVMVIILAGVVGLGYLDQSRYDAKVPLGTWYGTFTSHTGLRGAMFVVVRRKQLGQDGAYSASRSMFFPGSAQLCLTAQARQYFRLDGFTDQSGPGFTVYLTPIRRPPVGVQFDSDGLHGARHRNTLTMSGHLSSFVRPGVMLPSSDTTRQTRVTLARSGRRQFAGACRRLTAQTN